MSREPGISDEQARQILQRAAEIDRAAADVISIETLRAAAQEAGIAESSFNAALSEHTQEAQEVQEAHHRPLLTRRRLIIGALVGAVAAVFVFGRYAAPTLREQPSPPPVLQRDTPVTAPR